MWLLPRTARGRKRKVEFSAYTALVAVNGKQFSLFIALDIKRQFNKAGGGYILPQLFVFLFYFLAVTPRDFLYHSLQLKNF